MNYTIVDYFGYPLSAQERMKTIKQAGFDGVILLWADYFDGDYKDFPKYAEKEGLYVENAHAPYMQANTIWDDTITGEEYTDHIVRCIEDCSVFHIPTLVMHPINGMVPLPKGNVGIDRFKKIMEAAEKWNINIAIENQGNPEYLNFVFRNISSSRLYFCFDSGHERFYSPQLDLLDLYGDRLIALHLHDNNGQEDTHALPFTGDVQWDRIAGKLKKLDYKGAVALETLNGGFEHIESPVAFLQIALERAKKIL